MKRFIIHVVYGDMHNITAGDARAEKWKKLKKKSTLRLCPDDDSLTFLCDRANYLAYIGIHADIKDHPSPIGNGWALQDGLLHAIRYTKSAFSTELTISYNNTNITSYTDESSSDSASDVYSSDSDAHPSDSD